MLINDLSLVTKGFVYKPFLFACDVKMKTPAVTIVSAEDHEFFRMAENEGYPVITCREEHLFFPNGWNIHLKKPELIKTKLFHLMKRFYRLSDEIQIADNIKIHLINDWYEGNAVGSKSCSFVIFVLLSSLIYGGALKTDWFFRYNNENLLSRVLNYYLYQFGIKYKLSGDLIYLWSTVPKDKMLDFYFYEQDFCGVCKVTNKE